MKYFLFCMIHPLESQIATAEALENIYDKMIEAAQQSQDQYDGNHSLQVKILVAALATLAFTVIGLLVVLLSQLS